MTNIPQSDLEKYNHLVDIMQHDPRYCTDEDVSYVFDNLQWLEEYITTNNIHPTDDEKETPAPTEETPAPCSVGDVVSLNSGGDWLTVYETYPSGNISVYGLVSSVMIDTTLYAGTFRKVNV